MSNVHIVVAKMGEFSFNSIKRNLYSKNFKLKSCVTLYVTI